jgi:hypothetical protein
VDLFPAPVFPACPASLLMLVATTVVGLRRGKGQLKVLI